MKKNVFILIFVFAANLFAGGTADVQNFQSVVPLKRMHVSALNGPSGAGMAVLFRNSTAVADAIGIPVDFTLSAGVDVTISQLIKAETDVAVLPVQVAAKLYAKNNRSLVFCAVYGNSMFYAASSNGVLLDDLHSLVGKTIYCAGHGATPEYVMRYLLQQYGLSNSITLEFSIRESELAAMLASGKIEYALIPEPFISAAIAVDDRVLRGFDLQEIWRKSGRGDTFPVTVIVARSEFAQMYPIVLNAFLDCCRSGVEWMCKNPAEAAAVVEKSGMRIKAAIMEKSIPYCRYVCIPATVARPAVESLFTAFLAVDPKSIGGALPEDGFYYNKH